MIWQRASGSLHDCAASTDFVEKLKYLEERIELYYFSVGFVVITNHSPTLIIERYSTKYIIVFS